MRALQTWDEAHRLTPDERVRGSLKMAEVCDAVAEERGHPPREGRDEPPELWLRMLAHFRSLAPSR